MKNIEVEFTFRTPARRTGGATKKRNEPEPTIPRITRLVALAIKIEDMVGRGELRDYADVARLGHVTRARLASLAVRPKNANPFHLVPVTSCAIAVSEVYWRSSY